jgi:tagatose 1,6-diphosphate aldolase
MSDATKPVEFLDPGPLADRDLELALVQRIPGDPARSYAPVYRFHMLLAGAGVIMGRIDLRIGDSEHLRFYGGQIGYGVDAPHRGHHYAARSVRLLMPLARRHGFTELWITCNPDNFASRRTCELAGAELVEIVDLPPDTDMYRRGERQKCRYRLAL